MHRKSELPRTNELEWLHESYKKRKTRSLKLGVKANDALINKDYKPRQSSLLEEDLDAFKYIKQDRDLERVRQRYLKLTKIELVDLLIRMEQYIAYQNQLWLKNEFQKFES